MFKEHLWTTASGLSKVFIDYFECIFFQWVDFSQILWNHPETLADLVGAHMWSISGQYSVFIPPKNVFRG